MVVPAPSLVCVCVCGVFFSFLFPWAPGGRKEQAFALCASHSLFLGSFIAGRLGEGEGGLRCSTSFNLTIHVLGNHIKHKVND